MNKQIILNLPVKNLNNSKTFFSALGFTFNDRFSGENAAFMNIVGDTIQAMLTTEPFFQSLIDKPVAQAKEANEVVICLSCESRKRSTASSPRPWPLAVGCRTHRRIMASCMTRVSRTSTAICGTWSGRRQGPER